MASPETQSPDALVALMQREAATPAPGFMELADRVRSECGPATAGVLLYGSCLRANDAVTGIVDLLVIVDSYRDVPGGLLRGVLNALLPPNVYYVEQTRGTATLRCKYAVISLADFENGTRRWRQPYLWARFAQPSRLLHARDVAVRERICRSLGASVVTFLRNVMPSMAGETLTTRDIWRRGFTLSYGAELRPEVADRPERITADDDAYFARVTEAAAALFAGRMIRSNPDNWTLGGSDDDRRRSSAEWRWRRRQGTVLSILRWIKAAFTFTGGIDYAAWKIARHTGVRIEVTDRLRRHPLIYGWPVLWRLWRSGALR